MTAPRRAPSRGRQVAIFICLIALVTVGCEAGDIALAKDFVKQWALDHAVEIAKTKAGIESDDNLVNAAVGGYEAVKEIHEADDLMEAGRQAEDPKKMDEALKIRPRDWSYQLSRADLALKAGDMATYNKYHTNSVNEAGFVLMPDDYQVGITFHRQELAELEKVDKELSIGTGQSVVGFKSYAQCFELYDSLYVLATKGFSNTGVPGAEAQHYLNRRGDCRQLPGAP